MNCPAVMNEDTPHVIDEQVNYQRDFLPPELLDSVLGILVSLYAKLLKDFSPN
jgi:hypothetical protein